LPDASAVVLHEPSQSGLAAFSIAAAVATASPICGASCGIRALLAILGERLGFFVSHFVSPSSKIHARPTDGLFQPSYQQNFGTAG